MLTFGNNYDTKGRPLSPHVTIYAFPPAAISSITNRATGVGLFAGFAGAGALALVGADVPGIMSAVGSSAVGPVAKFIVAFPLTFHYLGGVRHFIWDYFPEEQVTNEKAEVTSFILFGLSVGVSAGAALLQY
jgi:succinate dehydrogenase (ubiquinone) cytochrome b560 subunit